MSISQVRDATMSITLSVFVNCDFSTTVESPQIKFLNDSSIELTGRQQGVVLSSPDDGRRWVAISVALHLN